MPREYLVIPMQPTPNGRMHIGHASGAYLRADVVARHLRRAGNEVAVITGSDVYENWILLDALDSGCSPTETCWRFHALIGDDLRRLGMDLEAWINPLDQEHATGYRQVHEQLLSELADRGCAHRRPERVPRSSASGRYVVGVWLLGNCPRCGAPVGGNACEECGDHFQPAEVVEPRARVEEGPLEWVTHESWFLEPPSVDGIIADVETADVTPQFADVAAAYLRRTEGSVRLSQPGSWGLKSPLAGGDGVLSNTFYAYCLYCGEVYRRNRRRSSNPFTPGSGTATVGFFGIDNVVAGIAAPHALASQHGSLRPFDHVVTNHFLTFEGQKCSTSRKHGLWLNELLSSATVTADELRYHLAHRAIENGTDDLRLHHLVEEINRLRGWRSGPFREALTTTRAADDVDGVVVRNAVEAQGRHLDPGPNLSLPAAIRVLDDWLFRQSNDLSPATWLTGVALLSEPFMPDLGRRVWGALHRPGAPNLATLAAPGAAPVSVTFDESAPLTMAEIRPYVHTAEHDASIDAPVRVPVRGGAP